VEFLFGEVVSITLNQYICRDSKGLVQLTDHIKRKLSFFIKYLACPALQAHYPGKIILSVTQLFHPELDSLNWIRIIYRIVFLLVFIYEYTEYL
jgi:hypothetical protein